MFELLGVKYKTIIDIAYACIDEHAITALTGISGSGKTTILKMLNKMVSPTQGKILFRGKNLDDVDSTTHRRKVAMLSQNPAVFEGNIRHNLTIGLFFQQKPLPCDDFLNRLLKKVHLSQPLDGPTANLSGGEKQRLALARVLLLDAQVYLLDEPSSALDEETEHMMIEMITEHVKTHQKAW